MTATQWKTIIGAIAAGTAFLLIQTDVPLDPLVKMALGTLAVILAVINPDRTAAAPAIPADEPSDGAMGAH